MHRHLSFSSLRIQQQNKSINEKFLCGDVFLGTWYHQAFTVFGVVDGETVQAQRHLVALTEVKGHLAGCPARNKGRSWIVCQRSMIFASWRKRFPYICPNCYMQYTCCIRRKRLYIRHSFGVTKHKRKCVNPLKPIGRVALKFSCGRFDT